MDYKNYKIEKSKLCDIAAQEEYMRAEQWCSDNKDYVMRSDDNFVYISKVEDIDREQDVRAVRDSYLRQYIDERFKNILMWEEMSSEEKENLSNYRRYLLDYTKDEDWCEKQPLDYPGWLKSKE